MYFSKHGFVIYKKEISNDLLEKIKKELIAKPIEGNYANNANGIGNFNVYIETNDKIYIPKMYAKSLKLNCEIKEMPEYIGDDINVKFSGDLRKDQNETYNTIINSLKDKKKNGAILQATAGSGKTVMALKIITELKKVALIIVNKITLLEQWRDEIKRFIPEARIGIIQGKICDTKDKDVIIGMIHTISSKTKTFTKEQLKSIGFVIIDECHHLSGKVFSSALFRINSKYTLGLSATPKKSNGLEYVFMWHLGQIECKSVIEKGGKKPVVSIIKLNLDNYVEVKRNFFNKEILNFSAMITELVNMDNRNDIIVDILLEKVKEQIETEKRKILVLSERREHAINLQRKFQEKQKGGIGLDKFLGNIQTFSSSVFLGGMKKEDLENSKTATIIFATFLSFGEAVNEPNLNTLVLTTPKKYVAFEKVGQKKDSGALEQIVRRIIRKEHLHLNPEIIDIFDNFSVYKSHGNSRKTFYKSHFGKECKITEIKM